MILLLDNQSRYKHVTRKLELELKKCSDVQQKLFMFYLVKIDGIQVGGCANYSLPVPCVAASLNSRYL